MKAQVQLTWQKRMNTFALMRDAFPVGFPIMSAILGGIVGSFLGVVAERVPGMVMDEEGSGNLLIPASHCSVCQHALAAWENIPLLSWLYYGGAATSAAARSRCDSFWSN